MFVGIQEMREINKTVNLYNLTTLYARIVLAVSDQPAEVDIPVEFREVQVNRS